MEIEAQGFNRKKAKLFQHFGGKIDCNGMTQKILKKKGEGVTSNGPFF